MGTLDDAIREHLELKRRSGASDAEITNLESEAFGPVRREAPRPMPDRDATSVLQLGADELPPPPVAPPVDLPEPPADTVAEHALPPREEWMEDEPEFVKEQSTSEFTATEAREATGEPLADYVAPDEEGEDLLEETPEFLQETPEHDRLWFEQKPPRDFDFDQ